MAKKSQAKKMRFAAQGRRARVRVPLLATLRTHRRVQTSKHGRNWRGVKLRLKVR